MDKSHEQGNKSGFSSAGASGRKYNIKKIFLITSGIIFLLFILMLKSTNYIEKPEFCKKCHSMKYYYNTWSESTHNSVTCFECHIGVTKKITVEPMPVTNKQYWVLALGDRTINISKLMNNVKKYVVLINKYVDYSRVQWASAESITGHYAQVFYMIIGRGNGKEVSWKNCGQCHESIVTKGVKSDLAGHKSHLSKGLTCQKCHGDLVHETSGRITRQECLQCHEKGLPRPVSHGTTDFRYGHGQMFLKRESCKMCHVKGTDENVCMSCHKIKMPHPDDFPRIHIQQIKVIGIKKCISCHEDKNAKQKKTAAGTVMGRAEACSQCHGKGLPHRGYWNILPKHGIQAIENLNKCLSCHEQKLCNDCHGGVPMPHPPNIAATHTKLVKNTGINSCSNCHKTGSGQTQPGAGKAQMLGKAKPCINCHGIDMPHPDGFKNSHSGYSVEICGKCHGSGKSKDSVAPGKNSAACQKCHSMPPAHHGDTWYNCDECHVPQFCSKCH